MKPDTDRADAHEAERLLRALLRERHVGVLATQSGGQPYASLVAFVADDTMRHLLFATPRPTRKFANLEAEPRVAMLIDSRGNEPEDLHRAAGATAVGSARELTGEERAQAAERFLARHPHMAEFLASPSTAIICVTVDTWFVVRRFQTVTELHMGP